MERKTLVYNLPTELKNLSLKEKASYRKCFLDDAEDQENMKQNLPLKRNKHNEDNYLPLSWQACKLKKPLQQINYQRMMVENSEVDVTEYGQNQQKIQKLRNKLQELYEHYQKQRKYIFSLKNKQKLIQKLNLQNQGFSNQIGRIRNMVKEALLTRQKNRMMIS